MIFPDDPDSIGRLYAEWALRAGQPDASEDEASVFAVVKSAIRLGPDESRQFHRAVFRAVRERFPDQDRATVQRAWSMIHRMAISRLVRAPRKASGGQVSPPQRVPEK